MSVQLPESRPYRVTFPHMGNYEIPVRLLAEELECEIVPPPTMTSRTLELGARHSPEFVCVPFKYNLGNYIEALDNGANLLLQAGGGCRFGYYAEVQEAILRDLGYDFGMVRLLGGFRLRDHINDFKKVNPRLTMLRALMAYSMAIRQTQALDKVEEYVRLNVGFEVEKDSFEQVLEAFLRELDAARSKRKIAEIERRYLAELAALPTERPDDVLRIGVVGELYVVIEPFSNLFVEKELAKRGVEVHRHMNVSAMVAHGGPRGPAHLADLIARSGDYVRYHVGAHGTESVSLTYQLMKQGFDGVIHLKPFGCMPEVNAMAALQRLSREHTFPILFISFDAQTSETGLKTRLDAFCDMLRMRRERPRAIDVAV